YQMGDRTGLELLHELNAHHCQVPVIVLTGHADPQLAVAMLKAGAVDYLVKGQFDGLQVERAIRYAIDATAKRRQQEVPRLVASRAPCLLWYAEVEELADGRLDWHLRIPDDAPAQAF